MHKEFMRREVTIRLRLLLTVVLLSAFVFIILYSVQSARVKRLSREAVEAQAQVLEAYAKVEELDRRLQFTETDEYIAQKARELFGYLGADETRFVPVDEAPSGQ